MNKIRTISTRIDSFIKNADLTNSPTLQQIHRDYCEGVMYINERLALCEDLLQKGRIGEAVIMADRTPSLFDLVPIIQAPNIIEFFDVCQIYGLQSPPLINISVYQSLERSEKSADVKEGLFAELRKLSRTQGSEDKVIILRKIIKLEPDNPEWKRQLKQAESTCVPALIQKAQQAITDMDYITLDALEETLSSHEWELVIPDVVLSKIRRVLNEEEQRQLRIRAKCIIDEIEKAYASQSLIDYNRANSHWKMLCNIDYYVPSEDENHRFAIADAFFQESKKVAAENEEYNNIIREFNGYIQSPSDVDFEDIEILYKRLATFNKEIPANITNFVNQQFALLEKHEKTQGIKRGFRKFIFFVLSILIIFIGCVGTWFAYNRKNLQKELAAALQGNDLKRAETLVANIRKSRLPYSLFSRKLRDLMANYDNQSQELKSFTEAAQKLEQALAVTPDESKKESIEKLLNECRAKATLPSTKKRLAVLESLYENNFVAKIKEKQQNILKEHLGRIRNSYNEYTQALKAANYSKADDIYKQYLSQLSDLKKIAYFDASSLTGEDKNIVLPFFWLLAKHKNIYSAIEAGLKANAFDALSSALDLYKENEKALLNEGTMAQITDAKLPSAADVEQQHKLAKNDKTLQDHIKNLEQLKKDLTAAIEKDQTEQAEELLEKFKALYETAKQVTPVSKEKADAFKKLDIAEDFSKKISGKKSFASVSKTFKAYVGNLYDNNSKNALIGAIEQAESSVNLTEAQKNTLKALRYQLEHLRKIYEFQKNISSAIWGNQNYSFFQDVANARLFEQKDKEFFEAMHSDLNDLCAKYRANETIYIAFRDSKGRIKSYSIPADKFKESLTSTQKNGVEVISFKSEKLLVTIEGNTVTEAKEVDGDETFTVFKNVTFLYPSTISHTSVSNAISPHQQLVFAVTDKVNQLPHTMFSKEYYDLLISLKKQKNYSPVQLLELYKLLLTPFDKMSNFTYEASGRKYAPFSNQTTRDALNDIDNLDRRIGRLLEEARRSSGDSFNTFDNKYNARIGRLNFDSVDKFIKMSLAIGKFRKMLLERTYNCIGVANFDGNNISFMQGDSVSAKTGEVWIFDPEGKIMLAGLCKDGKITWNELSFTKNHTSIVFVPDDKIDTVKKSLEYRNSLSTLGVESIYWPAILPHNVQR